MTSFFTALWLIGLSIFLIYRKRAIVLSSFVLLIPIIIVFISVIISKYLNRPFGFSIVDMVFASFFLLLMLYLILKYNGKTLFSVNIKKLETELSEYCETMDYKCKFNNTSFQIDTPNGEIKMNVNKWFNTIQFKNMTYSLLSENILNILLQNSGKYRRSKYLIFTIAGLILASYELYYYFA
jgi:hypothetical protein